MAAPEPKIREQLYLVKLNALYAAQWYYQRLFVFIEATRSLSLYRLAILHWQGYWLNVYNKHIVAALEPKAIQ